MIGYADCIEIRKNGRRSQLLLPLSVFFVNVFLSHTYSRHINIRDTGRFFRELGFEKHQVLQGASLIRMRISEQADFVAVADDIDDTVFSVILFAVLALF